MIRHFGTTQDGAKVRKCTIAAGGLTVSILTLGAILQDVRLAGVDRNLTLGSDCLADYAGPMEFFGPLVGPIANRISNARVRLDGMMYELERNAGSAHLHSGSGGIHRRIWDVMAHSDDQLSLGLHLPDGAAGLPGNRVIQVTYQVSATATLTMQIEATTDAATCMNVASHSYWNLDGSATWQGHSLQVAADHYLTLDSNKCPTGAVVSVAQTDLDFRRPRAPTVGKPPLDYNFCLDAGKGALRDVVWLTGQSGVRMVLATTEAGVQIYDGSDAHRPGRGVHEGLAIEPQAWPDAPNHRGFGNITMTPDRPYQQTTRWSFSRDF